MSFEKAQRHLKKADPVLRKIIENIGQCGLCVNGDKTPYFEALANSIIYQQLNGRAAQTILERFKKIYRPKKFPKPQDILNTADKILRGAGLSSQKSKYLKDLSAKILSGEVSFKDIERMSDEKVVGELIKVKGVGTWTAQMFLIFRLGRPDVLPTGDYAIKAAVAKGYRLKKFPSPEKVEKLAARWHPYCSVASWYLWESMDRKG
ncbi:MAG: DNA-3-methyladenine glycosylase [Elusimicrobia bacterium]|nr:DNA-3-methyladenine glycosylase [Elusimicrobiota bacterium]